MPPPSKLSSVALPFSFDTVVPGEMVRENFTFEAFEFKWIKAYTYPETTTNPSVGCMGMDKRFKIMEMKK